MSTISWISTWSTPQATHYKATVMPSSLWHKTIKHNVAGWGHYRPVSHSTHQEYPTDESQDWLLELEFSNTHRAKSDARRCTIIRKSGLTRRPLVLLGWRHSRKQQIYSDAESTEERRSKGFEWRCVTPWRFSSTQLTNSTCTFDLTSLSCCAVQVQGFYEPHSMCRSTQQIQITHLLYTGDLKMHVVIV